MTGFDACSVSPSCVFCLLECLVNFSLETDMMYQIKAITIGGKVWGKEKVCNSSMIISQSFCEPVPTAVNFTSPSPISFLHLREERMARVDWNWVFSLPRLVSLW